jgi:hypothetical protein
MPVTGPIPLPVSGPEAFLKSAGQTQNILSNLMANKRANQLNESKLQQYQDVHQKNILAHNQAVTQYKALQNYINALKSPGGNQEGSYPPIPGSVSQSSDQEGSYSPANISQMNANSQQATHVSSTQQPANANAAIPTQNQNMGINVGNGYQLHRIVAPQPGEREAAIYQMLKSGDPKNIQPAYKTDDKGNMTVSIPGKGTFAIRRNPGAIQSEAQNLEEAKGIGEQDAKALGVLQTNNEAAKEVAPILMGLNNVVQNKKFQNLHDLPFFRQTMSTVLANVGDSEIKNLITQANALSANLLSSKSKLFKGAFREYEKRILESAIPNSDDTIESFVAKVNVLQKLYNFNNQRANRIEELMNGESKDHPQQRFSYSKASKLSDKELGVDEKLKYYDSQLKGIGKSTSAGTLEEFKKSNPRPSWAKQLVRDSTGNFKYI